MNKAGLGELSSEEHEIILSERERDVSISGERDMDETEDIFEEVLIS